MADSFWKVHEYQRRIIDRHIDQSLCESMFQLLALGRATTNQLEPGRTADMADKVEDKPAPGRLEFAEEWRNRLWDSFARPLRMEGHDVDSPYWVAFINRFVTEAEPPARKVHPPEASERRGEERGFLCEIRAVSRLLGAEAAIDHPGNDLARVTLRNERTDRTEVHTWSRHEAIWAALLRAADERDTLGRTYSERVFKPSRNFGKTEAYRRMFLGRADLEPGAVLVEPGRLTPEEMAQLAKAAPGRIEVRSCELPHDAVGDDPLHYRYPHARRDLQELIDSRSYKGRLPRGCVWILDAPLRLPDRTDFHLDLGRSVLLVTRELADAGSNAFLDKPSLTQKWLQYRFSPEVYVLGTGGLRLEDYWSHRGRPGRKPGAMIYDEVAPMRPNAAWDQELLRLGQSIHRACAIPDAVWEQLKASDHVIACAGGVVNGVRASMDRVELRVGDTVVVDTSDPAKPTMRVERAAEFDHQAYAAAWDAKGSQVEVAPGMGCTVNQDGSVDLELLAERPVVIHDPNAELARAAEGPRLLEAGLGTAAREWTPPARAVVEGARLVEGASLSVHKVPTGMSWPAHPDGIAKTPDSMTPAERLNLAIDLRQAETDLSKHHTDPEESQARALIRFAADQMRLSYDMEGLLAALGQGGE